MLKITSTACSNSPDLSIPKHLTSGTTIRPKLSRQCQKGATWQRTGPVPGYEADPNKKVVVTYSSINGNGFGGWGEVVLGSKGTLILDKETDVLLYRDSDTSSKVGVAKQEGGYVLDTSASGDFSAGCQGCRFRTGKPRLSRRDRALGVLHSQPEQ